jgi:phosphatidylinositol glycan class U
MQICRVANLTSLQKMKKLAAAFLCSGLLRFVLLLQPWIQSYFKDRVELTTPVSSFSRLNEGLYLYENGVGPYDGGIFHQSPLLLVFFSLLKERGAYNTVVAIVYTLADLWVAYLLSHIHTRLKGKGSNVASYIHLFNPLVLMSTLSLSTSIFSTCFVLAAVSNAVDKRGNAAMLSLALATFLSLYPILLLPALIVLVREHARVKDL